MLKRAYAYQDHDKKWYLGLIYTYENDKGGHEVIFPKVNLPVTQHELPNIISSFEDSMPYFANDTNSIRPEIEFSGKFKLFESPTEDPRNGEKLEGGVYYDILVKPKVHKMTLKEVEEKLGYKVEIVSGK